MERAEPTGAGRGMDGPETNASVVASRRPLISRWPRGFARRTSTAKMAAAALMATLTLPACSSIGPPAVSRDGFDYAGAVANSWKSQMLFNLVKLRYGDAPMFLDVGQIVSGYTMQSTFTATGNLFGVQGYLPGTEIGSVGLGAQGQFTDRPTITYSPLVGEKFARTLMKPIPPVSLMSLIQAGDPISLVFRLAVQEVNGIQNRFGGDLRARPPDPEYYELLERLQRIQSSGGISMRLRPMEHGEGLVMGLRQRIDPALEADSLAVRHLLGLDPRATEFEVVYGSVASNDKEVALLTRSIIEILVDLASSISVPEEHVADQRVSPTPDPDAGPSGPVPPLIRIDSSADRPRDAFVAVPYRDHWFWIDDRDMRSKRIFSFLMFVFTLVQTEGEKQGAPIVTIPAG